MPPVASRHRLGRQPRTRARNRRRRSRTTARQRSLARGQVALARRLRASPMRRDSVAGVSRDRAEPRPLALGGDGQRPAEPARRLVEAAARQRQQLVGRGQGARGGAQRRALAVDMARRAGRAAAPPGWPAVASSSAFTGTAISAAPVGVGARMSAARSISVQSVSWPTAEISGMSDAATARASASSLKPQRSSRLPPPRATMIRSGRGIGAACGSALKPVDGRRHFRAARLALHAHRPDDDMQRKAVLDAVDDVADHRAGRRGDDADDARHVGQELLAAGVEQAFGGQPPLALLQQRHQRAGAGRLEIVDDDLVFRRAGIGRQLAGGDDLHPLLGAEVQPAHRALPDHRVDAWRGRPSG